MVPEKLYKILKPGQLIILNSGEVGIIVSVKYEFESVWENSSEDPSVYTAYVNGDEVWLIREAFNIL